MAPSSPDSRAGQSLDERVAAARACRLCPLPHPHRPILLVSAGARLLIVGQAPGTRVQETGIPWHDRSGDRLRAWLGLDRPRFYDPERIAILPIGLCFPGQDAKGADLPPRPECAPLWHPPIRAELAQVRLTLLVGLYAQAFYLGPSRKPSLTETVRAFAEYGPEFFPLPHPSWRNTGWLKRHPWFETELLPRLRQRVADALGRR
ncbi:MAG: uracil-DNA glycosylase family protein [Rhodospirillales bacterium]|nr:uracil-DNA glycosylase family protein [Rhodospirillales bacterium]